MRIQGKDLIFISNIHRDGKGVTDLTTTDMSHENNTDFEINSLSISKKTFIASEFNSYVVKKKNK